MTRYTVKFTSTFKKDYKRVIKQGMSKDELREVIRLLADGQALDPKYKDHPLHGGWDGHRECHIHPDWLLIYRYEDDILVLTLSRTGSHSELFGN